jgi:hypothetical protein
MNGLYELHLNIFNISNLYNCADTHIVIYICITLSIRMIGIHLSRVCTIDFSFYYHFSYRQYQFFFLELFNVQSYFEEGYSELLFLIFNMVFA